MKITILYYSATGNNEKMAGYISEGIKSVGDIEVKLMNLHEDGDIDKEFIKESSAVIFGTPVYCANICWQLDKWLQVNLDRTLAGKIGAVYATANYIHGGAETAISTLINHLLVKGMLVYSSGSGYGKPFMHLGPVALGDQLEEKADLFRLFGKRIAEKAGELFGDRE